MDEIKKEHKSSLVYGNLEKVEVVKQIKSCRLSMSVDIGREDVGVFILFNFYGDVNTYFESKDKKQNYIDQYNNALIESEPVRMTFSGSDDESRKFSFAAVVLSKTRGLGEEIEGPAVDHFVYVLSRSMLADERLKELEDRYRYLRQRGV